jgi:cytochrome c oxidase assembly protein subunit 15
MNDNLHPLKYRKAIIIWLLSGCVLIAAMVVIGGITRLTGSGLSITEWKLIRGTIPPLNEMQWQEEFENYKAIPQYQLLNYHYTLADFKKIFFWEYLHRLIGRIIGLIFFFPFLFFLFKKQFDSVLLKKVLFLFALGALQGFLGWFMVKSGLSERTSVSHIRLAIHLITAFITFGVTFKVALDVMYPQQQGYDMHLTKLYKLTWFTTLVLIIQLVYGAFVAGLKAGRIFNSWPKMDDDWISSSVFYSIKNEGISAFMNNMAVVQFIHRYTAYAVVLLFLCLFYLARNLNRARMDKLLSIEKKRAVLLLPFAVMSQFIIGVFTLLLGVPIWLGVLHQLVAFLLFALLVFLLHRFRTVPNNFEALR